MPDSTNKVLPSGAAAIAYQFGLFAMVGVIGTVAHYLLLFLLVEFGKINAVTASGYGALLGMAVNYWLNYGITFNSDLSHRVALPKFATIALIGFTLNILLMALLVRQLGIYYLLAQVLVTAVVLVWNFIGNRLWTFKDGSRLGGISKALAGHLFTMGPLLLAAILMVRLLTLGAYPLVDPSESRYAEMARKMVETHNWVTPQIDYGVPFWGKPPLAVWLNAFFVTLFGVNEFAVRFSGFLLSGACTYLVFRLAAQRGGFRQGFDAAIILAGMALYFAMSGSVAMDQALTLAVTLSLYCFWQAMTTHRWIFGYGFFLGLALGLMSKGPIGLVLTAIPIFFWVLLRQQWLALWQNLPWIKGTLLMLAVSVPWYLIAEQRTPGFLEYFLVGEHWKRFTQPGWKGDLYGAGRAHARGIIWFYWLIGTLPWSLVFLWHGGLATYRRKGLELIRSADGWLQFCLLWMLSPLLFFSISANTIWTYVLPGLPGCALLLSEWRRESCKQGAWNEHYCSSIALVVPVTLLGALLLWQIKPFEIIRTQKYVVEHYYHLRTPTEKLFYLRETPYSAQFYTRGKTQSLSNVEDFQTLISGKGHDYYVCPTKNWSDLPDFIQDNLKIVSEHGGFYLTQQISQGSE